MDEKNRIAIDINTASETELAAIPGLGTAKIRKIIAARPFAALSDLTAVGGVSPTMLERIRPYLMEISTPGNGVPETAAPARIPRAKKAASPSKAKTPEKAVETAPAAEEGEESFPEKIKDFIAEQPEKIKDFIDDQPENFQKVKDFIADQPEKLKDFLDDQPENLKKARKFIAAQPEKIKDFLDDQPEKFEKVKASTGMSNANLITLLIACLATMVITILLAFGLLGAINGGLRFAPQSEAAALSRQLENSAAKLEMLEKDTESIRTRLDALESMSGRMKLIEEENASIRGQLDESSRQVEEVRSQLEETRSAIQRLETSTGFFERILNGLRSLLNENTQP